jgi:hypothetical protein
LLDREVQISERMGGGVVAGARGGSVAIKKKAKARKQRKKEHMGGEITGKTRTFTPGCKRGRKLQRHKGGTREVKDKTRNDKTRNLFAWVRGAERYMHMEKGRGQRRGSRHLREREVPRDGRRIGRGARWRERARAHGTCV